MSATVQDIAITKKNENKNNILISGIYSNFGFVQ